MPDVLMMHIDCRDLYAKGVLWVIFAAKSSSARPRSQEMSHKLDDRLGLGCGLGLSIVKQIADVHNANINIVSGSICDGTTINIEFKKCLFNFI